MACMRESRLVMSKPWMWISNGTGLTPGDFSRLSSTSCMIHGLLEDAASWCMSGSVCVFTSQLVCMVEELQ